MSLVPGQTGYPPRWPAPNMDEPSQPWTTARCRRLLRPLISRISSLRKDAASCGQVTEPALVLLTSGPVSAPSTRSSRHDEEQDGGPEWLMPRKKRPRLTYSQRRGSQLIQPQRADLGQGLNSQGTHDEYMGLASGSKLCVKRPFRCVQPETQLKAIAPGEIAVSTPLLQRARGRTALSPVALTYEVGLISNQLETGQEHRAKTGLGAQKRLDERLLGLRESHAHKYANLEAIYRSFEALLRATVPSNTHKKSVAKGPRSLLEICLRKVPEYIVALEAWERLEAEQSGTISTLDEINTSAHIYNELESLGTNVGWRHLRVVVRADGVYAVKEGIKEGLLGDEFSQLIVDLCVQLGAIDEAEELITALVDRQYPQPASTDSYFTQSSVLQPLVQLSAFARQNQRSPFLFRQYSSLLLSGSLPGDWLATSGFEQIWRLATQALASVDQSSDAINFIMRSISLLCSRKRTFTGNNASVYLEQDLAKANQRTLMSSLSILASMRLLGETELSQPSLSDSDIRRIALIGNRLEFAIRACLNAVRGHTRGRGNQSLDVLYLTLFLSSWRGQSKEVENNVRGGIAKLPSPLETFLSTKECRTRKNYDNISWLIASVARAYSRGASVAPHQCLDELCKRLERLEIEQQVLDNLKTTAAFLIAQQTSNVRDLIYAESLHLQDRPNSGGPTRPHNSGTLFTGYRWEETIGEWVTASPARNKRQGSTIKHHLRSSALSWDTDSSLTRCTDTTSLVTETLSDTETNLVEGRKDGECSTDVSTDCAYTGQDMLRKRPHRIRNIGMLTTNLPAKAPVTRQNVALAASSKLQESHNMPGKENRVRLLAKKPRRSSGRVVLGTRSLSCDGRDNYPGGVYSDDELCI